MFRAALLLISFLVTFAPAVRAQTEDTSSYPALFAVQGVSKGDILYIRDKPSSSSSIIGAFEYDEANIEVIRAQDNWGLVNFEEGVGWASLDFLARVAQAGTVPATCFGTEPFWQAKRKQYEGSSEIWIKFQAMGGDEQDYLTRARGGSLASGDTSTLFAKNSEGFLVVIARREMCSDGMSDREFGFSAEYVFNQNDKLTHFSGCCSLKSPPASSR